MRDKDATFQTMADGKILMTGQITDKDDPRSGPGGDHMKFSAIAKLENKDGEIENTESGISCRAVSEVTIYLTAATNYDIDNLDTSNEIDPVSECEKILSGVNDLSYAEIKEAHIADHSEMFDRVSLSFGEDTLAHLPTNQRLNRIKEGAIDNGTCPIF